MKRNLQLNKVIGYLIVIISIVLAFYFLGSTDELINALIKIGIVEVLILVFLVIVSIFLSGIKILVILRIFNLNLSLIESASLGAVNTLWNYLPLAGGMVVRGAYLKRRYKFPWTNFIATVLASYFISLLAFGLFGLVVTLLFIDEKKEIFSGIFVVLIFTAIGILLAKNVLKRLNLKFINENLEKATLGLTLLYKNRSIFFIFIFVDILIISLDSSRLYLVSVFSGQQISFPTALLVTPLTILVSLFNITPGGLVIRESLISITTAQLNYSIITGIIIATIDRAAVLIAVFITGILGSLYLNKKMREIK